MNPNQTQIDSLYQQALGAQESLNQLYSSKGLTYDKATKKAKPIKPLKMEPGIEFNDLTSGVSTPPLPPPQDTTDPLAAYLAKFSEQPQTGATAVQTQGQGQSTALQKLYDLMGVDRGAVQEEIFSQNNVDQKANEVTRLTSEYNSVKRAAEKRIEEIRTRSGGGLAAATTAMDIERRKANSELADIEIQRQAAQGYYENAYEIAERKVKAEFAQLDSQIEFQRDLVDYVRDVSTKKELADYTAMINRQETDYKTMQNTKLALTQSLIENNRADLIGKLDSAQSPSEMVQIAGSYGIPISDKLSTQIQYAQLNKLNKEIEEMSQKGAGGFVDVQSLQAYATQYADTGVLPSISDLDKLGLNAQQLMDYAKQIPKANGSIVSTNTGTKPKNLSDKEAEGIAALTEIVQTTLPALQDRFGKINTGVLGGLFGKVFTSQDRQDYNTFRQEFLSKLLVARSGAAVTEQEYQRYADLLPGNFNQPFFLGADGSKKLTSLSTSMDNALKSVLNAKQLGVYGYSTVPLKGSNPPINKKIGEILDIGGTKYKVLADGTLTDVI